MHARPISTKTGEPARRHHPLPLEDRFSFLWLTIACAILIFSNGTWIVPLAAWVGPLFMVRFLRTQRAVRGLLVSGRSAQVRRSPAGSDSAGVPRARNLGGAAGVKAPADWAVSGRPADAEPAARPTAVLVGAGRGLTKGTSTMSPMTDRAKQEGLMSATSDPYPCSPAGRISQLHQPASG